MPFSARLLEEIDKLKPDIKSVMFELLKEIEQNREESITRRGFLDFVKSIEENSQRAWKAIEELAEAQKRTETSIEELAEAQKRTEEELRKLSSAQRDTQKQLGGLPGTVGYTLENESYKTLPSRLKKDFNIIVKDRLKRTYIRDIKGKYIEVNIIGKAERDGREIVIVGESKSQLSKRGVDDFIKKKLEKVKDGIKEVFPVIVTHMISEYDVEEYVKEKGLALYYSYDF